MKVVFYIFLLAGCMVADDVELYNKLSKEIVTGEQKFHTGSQEKVYIKKISETKLTKSVKKLLKKQKIAQTTKKFEKILKD